MKPEDLTTEVMVALAAGHVRLQVADEAHALIAADDLLTDQYHGVLAIVQELGPEGALNYLESAADRITLKGAVGSSGKPARRIPLWSVVAGIAASLAAVIYFSWSAVQPNAQELALEILASDPQLELVRDELPPTWAAAYEAGDLALTEQQLRATGLMEQSERLVFGIVLQRKSTPDLDSAMHYLEQAARMRGPLSAQAWLYAGALSASRGDNAVARDQLGRSDDPRAERLRKRL